MHTNYFDYVQRKVSLANCLKDLYTCIQPDKRQGGFKAEDILWVILSYAQATIWQYPVKFSSAACLDDPIS